MNNADKTVSPTYTRNIHGQAWTEGGLTKREECAMRNLQGILSNPRAHEDYTMPEMVKLAINSADLLFKELSK